MHVLAALDLATGKIFYRIRDASGPRSSSTCARPCEPAGRARSCAWSATTSPRTAMPPSTPGAPTTRSSRVPAAYGSWLNWIEAEFAALRYFALNGTDHGSHAEQNAAIASYVRWHKHPRLAEGQLRHRLTDPNLDRLPGQGCVTSRPSAPPPGR